MERRLQAAPCKQAYRGYFWMPQDTKEQIEKYKNQNKAHAPDFMQNIYAMQRLKQRLTFTKTIYAKR
jgi:hypothetical protein